MCSSRENAKRVHGVDQLAGNLNITVNICSPHRGLTLVWSLGRSRYVLPDWGISN